jgi:hypothetical protein
MGSSSYFLTKSQPIHVPVEEAALQSQGVYPGSRDSTGRWELVSEDRVMLTTVSKSRVPVVFSVTSQERQECQDLMAATLSHVQYEAEPVPRWLRGRWAGGLKKMGI